MKLSQLRRKHPRLIYQDFEAKPDGKNLLISFNFLLEPDIRFRPEISIPIPLIKQESPDGRQETPEKIKNLVFHLGMIEAVSYWKAACPPQLVVKAGYLSPGQIAWWKHLFIHGLGELFFRNRIDFTRPDFLTIVSQPSSRVASSSPRAQPRGPVGSLGFGTSRRPFARDDRGGDLILVGGGKDSIITLEALKHLPSRKTALMLNPGPNSVSAAGIAGYKNSIIVTRKIDPKLLQLNKLGYLNGHTPFSAYLAFLGVLVAYLHGYKNVISSNELGAGEAGLIYKSMEINHQYSKSFAFEKGFRGYCRRYISQDVNYFSFLRPLYELQIAKLFSLKTNDDRRRFLNSTGGQSSRFKKYDQVFVSCNLGRGKFWCGRCPKCAFNYLALFPFMSSRRLKTVFQSDLFENPQIQKHILDLVGLGQYKPFDCVGTKEESILAVALAIKKLHSEDKPVSGFLLSLEQKLHLFQNRHSDPDVTSGEESRQTRSFGTSDVPSLSFGMTDLKSRILKNWSDQNFLPPEYSNLLKKLLITTKRSLTDN